MSEALAPSSSDPREPRVIVVVVFLTALAGILYELALGTLSSLLLGDSVLEWSLTIGIFLAAMGLGSFLSGRVVLGLLRALVGTQLLLAFVGGAAPLLLFLVFAFEPEALRGALVLVLLALGAGIGLEIPLLTRLLEARGHTLRLALASVLAVDYLGALAASLAFPLVLYPVLGLVRTALLTGVLNVAAAFLLGLTFRASLGRARGLTALAVGTGTLLCAGLFVSSHLERMVSKAMYAGELIYAERSPYQTIALTKRHGHVALYLNGQLQLDARDERRYHEALVHPALTLAERAATVLVLGGGDGLAVRELLRDPRVAHVLLVDLDPRMTRLAREHAELRALNEDALRDPRVRIVHEDALRFLRAPSRTRFDVIVADLPDPSTPALARLYSEELYRLATQRLAPSGVLVTQATSPYFTRASFWCIETTMRRAGLSTLPYHISVPSFGEWGFVIGTRSHRTRPARARHTTTFLEPPHWDALFHFPADMARVPARASTITRPALATYYAREQRRALP